MSSQTQHNAAASRRARRRPQEAPCEFATVHPIRSTSTWLGQKGEHLRVQVRVEHIAHGPGSLRTYTARTLDAPDVLVWSSARRHGIQVGEHLALSGVVKSHLEQDGVCITALRDCFNPLRMA